MNFFIKLVIGIEIGLLLSVKQIKKYLDDMRG